MKILLITDQPLTACALQSMIKHCRPEAEVGSVMRLGEAMGRLSALKEPFDLIVLDLETHGTGRLQGASMLRSARPDVPLVVMSAAEREEDLAWSTGLHLQGYLSKASDMQALQQALRRILTGLSCARPSGRVQSSLA